MLKFTRTGEVCLPIHDSFIVRRKLLRKLEKIMKNEYERLLKKPISVKYEVPYQGFGISKPKSDVFSDNSVYPIDAVIKAKRDHDRDFSVVMRYRATWKAQTSSQAVRT